jgi:hypothetical protein
VKAKTLADSERYKQEYQEWKEFQQRQKHKRGRTNSPKETSPVATKPKPPKNIVPTMWTILKAAECHLFLIEPYMRRYLTREDILELIEVAKNYEGPSHIRENIREILRLRDEVAEKEREMLENGRNDAAKKVVPYVRTDQSAGASHGESYF